MKPSALCSSPQLPALQLLARLAKAWPEDLIKLVKPMGLPWPVMHSTWHRLLHCALPISPIPPANPILPPDKLHPAHQPDRRMMVHLCFKPEETQWIRPSTIGCRR